MNIDLTISELGGGYVDDEDADDRFVMICCEPRVCPRIGVVGIGVVFVFPVRNEFGV